MMYAAEACAAGAAYLLRAAAEQPAVAFTCAAALKNPAQRDRVLKQAWVAAMASRDKTVAARFLISVVDRPWVGDVNFFDAVQAASLAGEAQARQLLLAAAGRNPSLAIREVAGYVALGGGREAFERAARLAPNELVTLARGRSETAAAVRAALEASPSLAYLARLAARDDIGDLHRQRLAVFHYAPQSAVADPDEEYFLRLVRLRLAASGEPAMLYDRALAAFSQMLFVEARGNRGAIPRSLPAEAAYLLLSYGRTESDDPSFAMIFDALLAPKLKGGGGLAAVLDQTGGLQLRRFLTAAITHRRFDAVIGEAGLLERSLAGITTSEEAVAAAEIVDHLSGAERLRVAAETVAAGYRKAAAEAQPYYGLLAVRLRQRGYGGRLLDAIAPRYEKYLRAPERLDTAALFARSGVLVERHYFYEDQDGEESFASFRQTFERDPAWKWEDRGGWVVVTGSGESRKIVMVANVPIDLLAPANARRQEEAAARHAAVARYLAAESLAPAVVVHRGHSYHVEKTLRQLNDATRLIVMGSCRGTEEVDAVMTAANSAQVIATRGVGTQSINDPLLKALNTELLKGGAALEWPSFWAELGRKFGGSGLFADYIPPHRNSATIFLAAYHRYLAE